MMGRISISVAAAAFATVLVGCVPPKRATLNQLRVRSAFDLGCPQQMISLHYIDERTRGVVGCGRRLAYLEACGSVGRDSVCSWELDQQPDTSSAPVAAIGAMGIPASVARAVPGTQGPAKIGLVCNVVPLAAPAPPPQWGPAGPAAPPEDAPSSRELGPPQSGPRSPANVPLLDPFEDRH